MSNRLKAELDSFHAIWQGGYFEGDPLDPMAQSSYGQLGYMSVLHAAYLACIKPYVNARTIALEIGPGRGAWTKALLPSREVWAVDALPEEHNGFYNYLGRPPHVTYIQITDFSLADLPSQKFTYMFSFGALCHVSFDGITEYAVNAFNKMLPGSHCFWLVADYKKRNRASGNVEQLSPLVRIIPRKAGYWPLRHLLTHRLRSVSATHRIDPDQDDHPAPGRWYDAGTDRTCEMLSTVGWKVLDPDMGVNHRDPVIHFTKE